MPAARNTAAEPRELYDRLLRVGSLPPSLVRVELLAEAPEAP